MNNDTITFNGTQYPVRWLGIENTMQCIGTESLSKALLDETTSMPINKEAEQVDDTIFFYVPDAQLNDKATVLRKFIIDNIK